MESARLRIFIILLAVAAGCNAQTTATGDPASPAVEVASIKPSSPGERNTYIRPGPGGGLSIANMSLKEMVVLAYQVQPFQVFGGQSWMDSLHYDIVAKPEKPTSLQNEIGPMMRGLLADRFQLKIHRETKDLPIYKLVMARKDGAPGPGLVISTEGDCEQIDRSHPPVPAAAGEKPHRYCGSMMMGPNRLNATGVPVANLLPMLSRLLGRSVVDGTGLKGNYDVTVEWTPDETQVFPPPAGQNAPPRDAAAATLFTAFQERLGLKFEAARGPVELIVVERAEKPSDN